MSSRAGGVCSVGGGSGLVARMLSDGMTKRYGQPVVVINRPGGNTNIGTASVVRSPSSASGRSDLTSIDDTSYDGTSDVRDQIGSHSHAL